MSLKPEFTKAAETREERQARLEELAKALDDSLRNPKTPQPRLTPDGKLRYDGDALARSNIINQRVDISKQLEQIKAEIQEKERSMDLDKKKGLSKSRSL